MAETTTITVRVPQETRDKLDRLATATRRSRSFLASEALDIYVREELQIVEGILRGMEDLKAGRVIPHEQVAAELREIVAKAKRKAKRKAA